VREAPSTRSSPAPYTPARVCGRGRCSQASVSRGAWCASAQPWWREAARAYVARFCPVGTHRIPVVLGTRSREGRTPGGQHAANGEPGKNRYVPVGQCSTRLARRRREFLRHGVHAGRASLVFAFSTEHAEDHPESAGLSARECISETFQPEHAETRDSHWRAETLDPEHEDQPRPSRAFATRTCSARHHREPCCCRPVVQGDALRGACPSGRSLAECWAAADAF